MVSGNAFKSLFSNICALLCLIFFLSCSLKHPQPSKGEVVVKQKKAIEDVSTSLIYLIASEYYNYESNPLVHIHFQTKSTDKSVDNLFMSYIYNSIKKQFSKAGQISVVKKPDAPKDCSLIMDITKDDVEMIHIKATIYRADHTPLLEKDYSYKKDNFELDKFDQFKIKYTAFQKEQKEQADRIKKHGNTRLKVLGHTMGKILEARQRRDKCRFIEIYRISDHQYAGPRNSYFPTGLTCRINGKDYEPAMDKTIFDGHIVPGRIEFKAWFIEGFWDAYNCVEKLGEKHSKTFFVDIKRDDNIKIDILYIYDDRRATFAIRALKEITVVKNGKKIKKFKEIKVD